MLGTSSENEEVTVATISMNVVHDKSRNLVKYDRFIQEAAGRGARLVVFPEQSLQGYLYSLNHEFLIEEYRYHYQNAEPVDGPSVRHICCRAKEHNMVIVFGMTENAKVAGNAVLYNSAVVVGPSGICGVYRKVHIPGDEYHIYNAGRDWPVFDTPIGRIGVLICYDWLFPESCRELVLQGALLLVHCTAYPAFGKTNHPEYGAYLYDFVGKARAMENQVFFISSNQFGTSEKVEYDYLGQSRIIGPDGLVLSELGYEEGIAYATINVAGDVMRTRTSDIVGLNLLKDRRPKSYKHIARQALYDP